MGLEDKVGFLWKARNFINEKIVFYSLLGGLIFGAGCGGEEKKTEIPAGTVGKCVEVEVYPGYVTCLMSEPGDFGVEEEGEESSQIQSFLTELPNVVNHREDYMEANCPEVHDQGRCNWCVPHATTAAMEALNCREKKSEEISEPHLWYLGRGDVNNCLGMWNIPAAMETAKKNKLVPSSVWPFSEKEGEMQKTKPTDEDLKKKSKYSIDSYSYVKGGNIEAAKVALAEGNNIVYQVPIFRDVGWDEGDKTYGDIIVPSIENPPECKKSWFADLFKKQPFCREGYHAVLLIGYDNGGKRFLLRNSWGSGWADKGYGKISYDYIKKFGRGAYPRYCEKEICDGKDNDCDGEVDEGVVLTIYEDNDGDGFGDPDRSIESCLVFEGYVTNGDDCDDTDMSSRPINCNYDGNSCGDHQLCLSKCPVPPQEVCDGLDNNCDGEADEELLRRCYSACGEGLESCINGSWENCTAPQLLEEICDGRDNNCDGQVDEGEVCSLGGKIVFVSNRDVHPNDLEIWVMNVDGSWPRRLTNNTTKDTYPSFSPDGSKIAFISQRDNYAGEVYVMNIDGGEQRRLTDNSTYEYDLNWSPDGSKIAFYLLEGNGNEEIYVMNADGSGQKNLTDSPHTDYQPDWSPDGSKIAFVSNRYGRWDIYTMNVDGSEQRKLTYYSEDHLYPKWSPDGSKIIFAGGVSSCGGYGACNPYRYIWVMNTDGNERRRLFNDIWGSNPEWSPDGSKIAFNSIIVMNADGSERRQVTNAEFGSWQWSAGGGKFIYVSNKNGNSEIYVINVDGSGEENLTYHPAYDTSPSWSPK